MLAGFVSFAALWPVSPGSMPSRKNHWPLFGSLGDFTAGVTAIDGACGGWEPAVWPHACGANVRAIPATRAGMASQRITWERMLIPFYGRQSISVTTNVPV